MCAQAQRSKPFIPQYSLIFLIEMDPGFVLSALVDFVKYLLILSVIFFILYKLLSPLREKLADKYDMSWIRSAATFNLIVVFVCFLVFYLYFIVVGALAAPPIDPDIQFNLVEETFVILLGVVRVAVASVILAMGLLFFEFVASLVIDMQKKKKYSPLLKQFVGVLVAVLVFLLLFIFLFSWVPVGIYVYVFYGGIPPTVL